MKWNAQLQEGGPDYNLDFGAPRWTPVTITRDAATLVDIKRPSNDAHPQCLEIAPNAVGDFRRQGCVGALGNLGEH